MVPSFSKKILPATVLITIFAAIFLLAQLPPSVHSAKTNRSTFGEHCNRTRRCESGVSLICRNKICECIKPDIMIFDTDENRCLVLVREKCRYFFEAPDDSDDDDYLNYDIVSGSNGRVPRTVLQQQQHLNLNSNLEPNYQGKSDKIDTNTHTQNSDLDLDTQAGPSEIHTSVSHFEFPNWIIPLQPIPPHSPIYPHTHVVVQFPGGTSADRRYEYDACVPNAFCNDEHVCSCNRFYYESANATCTKMNVFNEPCEDTSHCRFDLHLSCISNTCQCDPTVSYYESEKKRPKCVGLADKPCLNGECVESARCVLGICRCNPPFVTSGLNIDGSCDAIGYGGECGINRSDNLTCHPSLTCRNNECKCKYDREHQVYDMNSRTCRSFAWGPCDYIALSNASGIGTRTNVRHTKALDNQNQCVDKAECVNNEVAGLSECQCTSPYVENYRGICEDLAFGVTCPIGKYNSPLCDRMVPLFCRNGKCDCEDELKIYDPTTRSCRGIVGSICYNDKSCVHDAICKKPYNLNDPMQRGQCMCVHQADKTSNRTCVADLQAPPVPVPRKQ